LELLRGRPPNPIWPRLSPDPAFDEKLKILIEDLTTPPDDRVPPFLRIFDADPQWRRYLFGRQRPETQVEAMSWYWRVLLMMTLVLCSYVTFFGPGGEQRKLCQFLGVKNCRHLKLLFGVSTLAPVSRETSCGTSRQQNKASIRQGKNFGPAVIRARSTKSFI